MHSRHHHGNEGHLSHSKETHNAISIHPGTAPVSVTSASEDGDEKKYHLQQMLIIIISVSVVVTVFAYFQLQSNPLPNAIQMPAPISGAVVSELSLSAQWEQYNRLVTRANELVRQYKSLSGQTHLPPELSFQFIPSITSLHGSAIEADSIYTSAGNAASNNEKTNKFRRNRKQSSSGNAQTELEKVYPSNPRDLVLGMAYDVDAKNIAVFIKSLRNVSNANCILFVRAPVEGRIQDLGHEYKIKLIAVGKDKVPNYMQTYHPSTLRWHLFRSFFTDHEGYKMIYNRVFLLDVRDTYFQHDPFTFFSPDMSSFHVFQGVTNKKIGECTWNSGWIQKCFDASMLAAVSSQMILCSGTVAGSMDRVAEYIELMGGVVSADAAFRTVTVSDASPRHDGAGEEDGRSGGKDSVLSLTTHFPSCESNGVDQGVHNVLVHRGALAPVTIWTQDDGPVANLQAQVARVAVSYDESSTSSAAEAQGVSRPTGRRFPRDISVRNVAGEALVVHQYDRHPQLQRALFQRFVDWVNVDDFVAIWQSEPACAQYEFVDGYDAYAGRCDIPPSLLQQSPVWTAGVSSAAQCCSRCEAVQACVAFAYTHGQCFLKSCRDATEPKFSADLARNRDIIDASHSPRSEEQAAVVVVAVVGDVVTGRRRSAKN